MKYCIKCSLPFDEERCPVCKKKSERVVKPDDLCFLTEKDHIWSGMLSDVLKQNDIPFIQKGNLGAGIVIRTGPMFERIRFYVLYKHLEQAREIVDELFSPKDSASYNEDLTF